MFARTQRLLLRPGWRDDAAALTAAIGEYAIVSKLARAPWPYTLADAEEFLAAEPAPLPYALIFARTRGAPRLVGGIGLDQTDAGVELGYWIARPYWGLGFATEAARAVVEMADNSLRLPCLVAGHFADNPASAHVLRKLGFEPTGTTSMRSCRARSMLLPCVGYRRMAGAKGEVPQNDDLYDPEDALAA
jgi:RimJ/RimL family protein N-acetyltransferase